MKTFLSLTFTIVVICCVVLVTQSRQNNETQVADANPSEPLQTTPVAESSEPVQARKPVTEVPTSRLSIGSVAPPLDVEFWIHDGQGKFPHVSQFESGKVYVVEFWATWCGPCVASMPHIVELQQKYKASGVQVISITKETPDAVDKFLSKPLPSGDQTYRDLTSSYCLTADPDQSSSTDYMAASGQTGIPCAFVVGKTGLIEWIGHPMDMEMALHQIVDDAWDREQFAGKYESEKRASNILRMVSMEIRKGRTQEALKIVEAFIGDAPSETMQQRFRTIKLQILMQDPAMADQMLSYAQELLSDKDMPPQAINDLAWGMFNLANRGKVQDREFLQQVIEIAQQNAEAGGQYRASLLDTVAHLQLFLGDKHAALKTQTQAVESATGQELAAFRRFLNELQESVEEEKGS